MWDILSRGHFVRFPVNAFPINRFFREMFNLVQEPAGRGGGLFGGLRGCLCRGRLLKAVEQRQREVVLQWRSQVRVIIQCALWIQSTGPCSQFSACTGRPAPDHYNSTQLRACTPAIHAINLYNIWYAVYHATHPGVTSTDLLAKYTRLTRTSRYSRHVTIHHNHNAHSRTTDNLLSLRSHCISLASVLNHVISSNHQSFISVRRHGPYRHLV